MENEKPEPKIPGGASVTFKQGEPTRVEVPVKYFVDDWFQTDFGFRVSDGVAHLRKAESPGDKYWFRQNEQARQKAYEVVENLPVVSEVERLHD